MIKTVHSVSDDLDPIEGVRSVIKECKRLLGDREAHAGLFFTSCLDIEYAPMLAEIHKAFPEIELIGCTTDGEITQDLGYSEESSALLILSAGELNFAAALAENISSEKGASIHTGFEQAKSKLTGDPALALVLPDGLSTMSVPIDAQLRAVMGESLPIFGGSAGDGFQIKQTFQFQGNRVCTDAMPMLLISGDLDMDIQIATGPVPSGQSYPVNRAEGNVIYRIDGVTSLEFFERFYGPYIEDRELSFFPLAVYSGEGEDFVLRDPVAINRHDGSVSFVGQIEEPCRVSITQVTREDTLRSGHEGSEKILSAFGAEKPDLILVFSCTSRRHVLGSRTNEEFAVFKQDGNQVPFFGFYCYGEIGPFYLGKPVSFHSDTCITVALRSHDRTHG